MCLLALLYRVANDAAVVVGANREEYYQRGGDPPRRLAGAEAVGGVDPTHGGTWLGVNFRGVLIAVTNRRKSLLPPQPRSRGLLVRELLAQPSSAGAAQEALRQLATGDYAGCNLLCADDQEAIVIHSGDWLRVRPLPPGVHVLSNRDVNDPTDARVVFALERLARQHLTTAAEAFEALRRLCSCTEPADAPVCFQHDQRGTVSSSLIALRRQASQNLYLHAQGAPDRTPYFDYSDLLKGLQPQETEGQA